MATGDWVWYDLMTTNIGAACDFYRAVAGYTFKNWDGPAGMPPYTMLHVGERSIGGVALLPEEAKTNGAPPHWLAYIQVEDVDAKAKDLAADGARVCQEPTDIPTVGRFAILADPQGAVFAIFQPASGGDMPSRPEDPQPGDMLWAELSTTDAEAGLAFYQKHFDWVDSDKMDMGPMGTYHMYKKKGDAMASGGVMNKPEMMPASAWLYYLKVPNVNEALDTVQKNGGRVVNGPTEVPGGDVVAQCMDPHGAAFAIAGKGKAG